MRLRLKTDRLTELLAASPLSQNHWAIKLGLSKGHWSEIVNGKHPYPSARTRTLMVEAFGVPVDELFELEAGSAPEADVGFQRAIADRYIIDSDLGQGGMGAVYVARDARHGRIVAVKVISPEAVSGIGLAQFHREISLVARLQHPHILPFYDSGDADGHPFYVMPLIRGGSLRRRLTERVRLPVHEVVRLTKGVAAALGHAHREHVLHCDVKPENILLDGDHPYVMDFGIARTLHAEAFEWGPPRSGLDTSAGTPAYVSPEQAGGDRDLDARSDVYSLACVAFEMLAGRPPFEGTTTQEVVAGRFAQHTASLRAFAPDVPSAMEAVIARAMSVRRDRRPHDAEQFAAELERAALSASPVATRVALSATRLVGSVRRRMGRTPAFRGGVIPDLADVRFALRQARRAPTATLAMILTLAVGIGATSAIFSAVNGVLLRPLPFAAPDRLVRLWETSKQFSAQLPSAPNLADWRTQNTVFTDIGAYSDASFNIGGTDPERVHGADVSAAFFRVLGVAPEMGRALADDDITGHAQVAVIGDALWRSRFGADRSVVGRTVDVNGRATLIVGVMPPSFRYPNRDTDMWAPLIISPDMANSRGTHGYWTVARLRPGITLASARAQMKQIAARLAAAYPGPNEGHSARVEGMQETLVGGIERSLYVLSGAAAFVFFIACINVVALLLSRAIDRRRENAVRVALGVSRARLLRQYLTESVLIATAGGAAGLALAHLCVRALGVLAADLLPPATSVSVDARATAFTVIVSILAGIACGLLPALHAARSTPVNDLRTARSSGATRERHRLRDSLVIAQVASALVLLTGAGLLMHSLRSLYAIDPGIRADGAVTMKLALPDAEYDTPAKIASFYQRALNRIAQTPGVKSAGLITLIPLENYGIGSEVYRKDADSAGSPEPFAETRAVSANYFQAAGMTLLQGRTFDAHDDANAPGVAVIDQTLAGILYPGQSPLGHRLGGPISDGVTIIGVVSNVHQASLTDRPSPGMYLSVGQAPAYMTQRMSLVIRATGDPLTVVPGVRRAILETDPSQPIYDVKTLSAIVAASVSHRRLDTLLLGALGLTALVLAAIGLYGLMASSVAGRTREIGVRVAIGGTRRDVLQLVIARGLRLTLAGVAIGAVAAFAVTRVLASLLYETSPTDAGTFIAVPMLLLFVAVAACTVPAWRALRVDPVVVLRHE